MKNIHLIPTDKPSRLVLDTNNKNLFLTTNTKFPTDIMKFQNIFIINDEVPKLDEWAINTKNNVVFKCKGFTPDEYDKKYCKKIILTTDMDLIKDSIQPIDDEFLEWFVVHPSCEEVEINHEKVLWRDGRITHHTYKIIIPKEEPKQERERGITITHVGKQETFEEVAEIFVRNRFTKQICNDESYPDIYASKASIVESHILFAKWQMEKSYSEEDMRKMYDKSCGLIGLGEINDQSENNNRFKELIEQFKKK